VFDSLGAIVTLTRDIVTGNLDALKADFNAASDGMTKHFVANLADMKSAYDSFAKTVGKVFGTEGPEEKAPKKPAPLIPDLASASAAAKQARDEDAADLKASLKEELDQIRATNLAEIAETKAKGLAEIQIKQQDLDTAKTLNQVSADQEEQVARDLTISKYNIELKAMQDEAALRSTDPARKIQLAAQETILYQKMQTDINRIHNLAIQSRHQADIEAAQAQVSVWRSITSPIDNAIQQITNGVLQGTQTLSQAWRNAATSMVVSLANAGEQVIENMAINLAKGLLLQKTAAGQSIMIDAKKAFSGAYSSASAIPYVGWILGPIAGAAAFAAVMAQASFAVGTGNVPGDMTAQVHRGEIIVPATMSDSIRSGQLTLGGPAGGGGGSGGGNNVRFGDIHIHGTTPEYDARKLLQILHRGLRDNPSMKLGIA
jgi:hypothetical protein